MLCSVVGTVITGDRRGRVLGFPTANVALAGNDEIDNGVYAALVDVDGVRWPAAVNVGTRPTVDDSGRRLLEAHLLDFTDDIYGAEITVHLVTRLRAERKFESLDALVAQLRADVSHARALLIG
jgi:riboflavin kinase/FMN adenylyltransferase